MTKQKQKVATPVVEVKHVNKNKGVGATTNFNKSLSKLTMIYSEAKLARQKAMSKKSK